MTERVRLRVWLVGVAPLVLVAALGVYLLTSREDRVARRPVARASESVEVPPPPQAPAVSTPTAATSDPRARPAPPAAAVPATAGALGDPPAEPPERVPEVEAMFALPPGSGQWSDEQKKAYRVKTFDDLDKRERTLESEIAAARRSGDREAEQRKTATLSYLRQKRAEVEGMLQHGSRDGGS